MLQIRLFGEPEVLVDGEAVRWSAPPRTISLLARLALSDSMLSRGALAAELWPDCSDDEARANLRRHIHHLQRALPQHGEEIPWLLTDAMRIGWNPAAPAWIDVLAFERYINEGKLRDAIELYRGEVLAGSYDEWLPAERERLRTIYLAALWQLVQRSRAARDFAGAHALAERILTVDEWREDVVRTLMSLRFEAGDRAGALATFDQFATRLREVIGVEPMPETLELEQAIRNDAAITVASGNNAPSRAQEHSVPFAGRDVEFATLLTSWHRAASGDGRIVAVRGEAGIGKSRLVRELATRCDAEGARVLWGAAGPSQDFPYEPLATALRNAASTLDASLSLATTAILSSIIPELRTVTPHAATLENDRERTRLLEAIVEACDVLALRRPLVLILEDLQWAAVATLDAVAHLRAQIGDRSILIIITYRFDAVARQDAIVDLQRRFADVQTLSLRRLSDADITTIVDAFAPPSETFDEVARRVFAVSNGNPLVAIEALRAYAETRELPSVTQGVDRTRLITDRFDRLPSSSQRVAEIASVVGVAFSVDTICGVTGWDEIEVLDALGPLIDRHLVREVQYSDLHYTFSHHLLQAAVYTRLQPPSLQRRHRRVAAFLETTGLASPATIAEHWERADDSARAYAAYIEAASSALRVYANADATALAERALRLAATDAQRFAALAIATNAAYRAGDTARLERTVSSMESTATALGDEERYAAARSRERLARRCGDTAAAAEALAVAQSLAELLHDPRALFDVCSARGAQNMESGKHLVATEDLRKALQIARDANVATDISATVHLLVRALVALGRIDEAERELNAAIAQGVSDETGELLKAAHQIARARNDRNLKYEIGQRILEAARRCGDVESEADAHLAIGHPAWELLRFEEARSHFETAIRIYERIGKPRSQARALMHSGGLAYRLGDLDEVSRCNQAACDVLRRLEAPTLYVIALLNEAEVALLKEDYARCDQLAREALEYPALAEYPSDRVRAQAFLGIVAANTSDPRRGLQLLKEAVESHRAVGFPSQQGWLLTRLIDVAIHIDDINTVASSAKELQIIFEQPGVQFEDPANALYALARAAHALKDERNASRLFDRAWDAFCECRKSIGNPVARERFERAFPHHRALLERYKRHALQD